MTFVVPPAAEQPGLVRSSFNNWSALICVMQLGDVCWPVDLWLGVGYTCTHTPSLGTVSLCLGICVGMLTGEGEHLKQTQVFSVLFRVGFITTHTCTLFLPWKGSPHICSFCSLSIYTYQMFYCLEVLNNHLYVCEVSSCQPGWTVRQTAAGMARVCVSHWVPRRSSAVNGGDKRYSH